LANAVPLGKAKAMNRWKTVAFAIQEQQHFDEG
jgi:hypothetical protein